MYSQEMLHRCYESHRVSLAHWGFCTLDYKNDLLTYNLIVHFYYKNLFVISLTYFSNIYLNQLIIFSTNRSTWSNGEAYVQHRLLQVIDDDDFGLMNKQPISYRHTLLDCRTIPNCFLIFSSSILIFRTSASKAHNNLRALSFYKAENISSLPYFLYFSAKQIIPWYSVKKVWIITHFWLNLLFKKTKNDERRWMKSLNKKVWPTRHSTFI